MTPDAIDELLRKLNDCALDIDGREFGLPMWPEAAERLRSIVAQWAAGQSQSVLDQLKTIEQTLMEVRHAQEVGADWYTQGRVGLYGQVAMWVRKGFEAINKVKSIHQEPPP